MTDYGIRERVGPALYDALVRAGAGEREIHRLVTDPVAAGHMVRLLKEEGMFLPLNGPGPISLARPEPEPVSEPAGLSIDCSVELTVPDGWSIEPGDQLTSTFRGSLAIADLDRINLYLVERQRCKAGSYVLGYVVKEDLEGQRVFPANLLDWLIDYPHPELIPESWKNKLVYFWGTIYRDRANEAVVRYIRYMNRQWCQCFCPIERYKWFHHEPAAVYAGIRR